MIVMLKGSDGMTVDEAMYQLISFSVARNYALEKGEKKAASRIASNMRSFCFRHLSVCRKAAEKFKAMSDDEKIAFYRSYGKQAEEQNNE